MYLFFIKFTKEIFFKIPSYLGGAKPSAVSIIANDKQVEYLSNFNIGKADNVEGKPSVETSLVCNIYQNKEIIIIGVVEVEKIDKEIIKSTPRRVLILKQDQISGLNPKPRNELGEKFICDGFYPWQFN